MKSLPERQVLFLIGLLTTLLISGCTSIRPSPSTDLKPSFGKAFSYHEYSLVLQRHVDSAGLVDYSGLAAESDMLERFYARIAAVSPDSHPHLFPHWQDRLAYWINAYNATVLKGVLHHYPISSVTDVQEPRLLFFFPERSGFFFFQRFLYGGREMSLYALENDIIRKRFADPRYHFALNCASLGCPELPPAPFMPENLDERLDQEAAAFINDPRHVRYDRSNNTLYLSSIFSWYTKDFTKWLSSTEHDPEHGLARYVLSYLDEQTANFLRTDLDTVTIRFLDYDWSLNDRRRAAPGTRVIQLFLPQHPGTQALYKEVVAN